jgi:hypothetical protein
VLSREPHPTYYGFGQPDSLEERQEYIRLASAELDFEIPWIIDDMDNTLQRSWGRMPNMEFIIASDGTLLASWEWARPDELKQFLEENVGPSGISVENWKELSQRRGVRTSYSKNDEVPGIQVPYSSLASLEVEYLSDGSASKLPFSLEAGTLPPEITPSGQSRLYLTIKPDEESGVYFDSEEAPVIQFSDVSGIELKKEKVLAGLRRSVDKDIYPHALGAMWSREEGSETMSFTATVMAKVGIGDSPVQEQQVKFKISGPIPSLSSSMDEVLEDKLPPKENLKVLHCQLSDVDADIPFNLKAYLHPHANNSNEAKLYLILEVDEANGFKWNNLAAPQEISLKSLSGALAEKDKLIAGNRKEEDDAEDRILVLNLTLEAGIKEFTLDASPWSWVCNNNEGWCREFSATYKVSGKL